MLSMLDTFVTWCVFHSVCSLGGSTGCFAGGGASFLGEVTVSMRSISCSNFDSSDAMRWSNIILSGASRPARSGTTPSSHVHKCSSFLSRQAPQGQPRSHFSFLRRQESQLCALVRFRGGILADPPVDASGNLRDFDTGALTPVLYVCA